jgi:hypothetical protein
MTISKRRQIVFQTQILIVLILLSYSQIEAAGTITITKNVMTDKTNNSDVTSGYADASLPVEFKGEATCSCESPSIAYTWHFGDGNSANGAIVSHEYGDAGAGDRSPYLHCSCGNCGAVEDAPNLTVHAIKGIQATKIGDIDNPTTNGRLCFDSQRLVTAKALPDGVAGSDKIDWDIVIVGDACVVINSASGNLPSPSPWPTSNASWGANTLHVSIDSSHSSLPGQDGELNLTGTPSYISSDKSVKVFFDLLGSQNPSTATPKPKNWFYYWRQTSANAGTMHYAASGTSHCDFMDEPDYPCYLVDSVAGPYNTPDVGKNANTYLNRIDHFAWTSRHEWRHHGQATAWWGAGGWVAANDADAPAADGIPDSIEAAFAAAEGGPFDNTMKDTFTTDSVNSDLERNAVFTQEEWTVGSADDEDWAHPGNQWP